MPWYDWIACFVAGVLVVGTLVLLWVGWVVSDGYDKTHPDDC